MKEPETIKGRRSGKHMRGGEKMRREIERREYEKRGDEKGRIRKKKKKQKEYEQKLVLGDRKKGKNTTAKDKKENTRDKEFEDGRGEKNRI